MVHSKIKYGLCSYGFAKKVRIDPLRVIQKKLAKVLLENKMQYPTNKLHQDSDILKVNGIFKQEEATFVLNYLKGTLPEFFCNYFKTFGETHSIRTRNSNKLITPLFKGYGVHNVKSKGCSIWNSLSNEQREIQNQKAFRKVYNLSMFNEVKQLPQN